MVFSIIVNELRKSYLNFFCTFINNEDKNIYALTVFNIIDFVFCYNLVTNNRKNLNISQSTYINTI